MEGISDIRIAGMDDNRPPQIRKEPYIDLYFKLSHKAPLNWCKDFNDDMAKSHLTPKIKPEEGLFIETWVRTPDEIPEHLKLLQTRILECNNRVIEKVRQAELLASNSSAATRAGGGEQGRLNQILADLKFEVPKDAA